MAAGAAAVAPLIVPRGVLALGGRPGANDRIVTGHIGVGARGAALLERIPHDAAALCDADQNHLHRAAAMVGPGVALYKDYREVLDRTDIDAVVIATPDHWHGLQTVHACEAGKDVYIETPACKTIAEGQAMTRAAKHFGSVVQVGATGCWTESGEAARAYVRRNALGPIREVACYGSKNPLGGSLDRTVPAPAELDWDSWLGPARWVPYHPDRAHGSFRWLLDFGGGQIRNQGAQVFAFMLFCLDVDQLGRVRVDAMGEPPGEGLWDCPITMHAGYQFASHRFSMTWSQPASNPMAAGPCGAVVTGTEDSLIVQRCDEHTVVEEKAASAAVAPSLGQQKRFLEHWFACIRTRKEPVMGIRAGVCAATLCILGNLAYRLGRDLEWDEETGRFINDAQANRLLGNPGRGPWRF